MNVNNIVVEELGEKYKDKRYNNLYQIQLDYKNPPISKMVHLDKDAILALNTHINTLLGTSIVPPKVNIHQDVSLKHQCGKDCDIDLKVLNEHKKSKTKSKKSKKIARSKQSLN